MPIVMKVKTMSIIKIDRRVYWKVRFITIFFSATSTKKRENPMETHVQSGWDVCDWKKMTFIAFKSTAKPSYPHRWTMKSIWKFSFTGLTFSINCVHFNMFHFIYFMFAIPFLFSSFLRLYSICSPVHWFDSVLFLHSFIHS